MVTDKIQELAALKARAAKLQASIESQRDSELATLPSKYGYDSLKDFIKALQAALSGGGRRKRKGGRGKAKSAAGPKPKAKAKGKGKRKRAKITPELKAQVKAGVEAGKTGAVIAKELGISLPSVQNIKKEFGLVKKRG